MTTSDYPKDAIVAELLALIKKRADEGMQKYGTPMTRTDLQPGFWQQAAIEEMIDFLLYFLRLRRTKAEALDFAFKNHCTLECCRASSGKWAWTTEQIEALLDFIYGTGPVVK
jgi:hypothetical protein